MAEQPTKRFVDPRLYDYSTERQAEVLDALEAAGGNQAQAARSLGVIRSTVTSYMSRLKERAAKSGWAPDYDMTKDAPDPFYVKGTSTYYGRDPKTGEMTLKGQWVKTKIDEDERLEIIRQIISDMSRDVRPVKPVPMPDAPMASLLNLYTMTDCHLGMLAWKDETGDDWDLDIGERVLTGCFEAMVKASPRAKSCVVAQLGDFLHFDSLEPITPTSKNILDVSARFPELAERAVAVLRRLIRSALERHETVYVLMAEGNHDISSSVWLREIFSVLYEDEPRVVLIRSQNPYYTLQHGKVMLGWHHGHKKGLEPSTGLMFASRNAKMFGGTEYRYLHFGDKHHWSGKEIDGFYLEQHPTLSGLDAYAARGGYGAKQRATAIVYHSEYGEASRHTVTPAMLAP